MEQVKDIETLLTKLPRFRADSAFKETLGERIGWQPPAGGESRWVFLPRLATIMAFLLLVVGGGYYIWKTGNVNIFRPAKVMAAEIIKRSQETFFKSGTIYHHRLKQYGEGATEPSVYELWADMDTQRFRNHVIYPVTGGGTEVWQWFDLDVQWNVDVAAKTTYKDIYRYQSPQERTEKKGEAVDLAQRFDELVSQGELEAKEGKLDSRDVYVVYDTRTDPDKFWDILTFDRQTFQLLRTEKYRGEGDSRKLQMLVEYELQESLPKTDDLIKQYFSDPPINLDGFTVTERIFDTSRGYLDDGNQVSSEKPKIIGADFTESCQILIKTTNKDYTVHTGYEDVGAGRCYQYAQIRISPSGQYVAYQDISGGIDSKVSLFVLSRGKSYSLGVYGTSTIFGMEFLPDDRLVVSFGFQDTQPPEQSLTVFDIPQMVKNLPADEDWYTNQEIDLFIKNLDIAGLDQIYGFLVITGEQIEIKDVQGRIGRSFSFSAI